MPFQPSFLFSPPHIRLRKTSNSISLTIPISDGHSSSLSKYWINPVSRWCAARPTDLWKHNPALLCNHASARLSAPLSLALTVSGLVAMLYCCERDNMKTWVRMMRLAIVSCFSCECVCDYAWRCLVGWEWWSGGYNRKSVVLRWYIV
jgi:hypothetical protein